MAYNGFFQSLPQVVFGAFVPANDVGMAMEWLGLNRQIKIAAAVLAFVAMPLIAVGLTRSVLSLADAPRASDDSRAADVFRAAGQPGAIGTGWARTGFIFRTATLPALVGIALIIPFRVPREWIEVVMVPVVVTVLGVFWMQASAWALTGVAARGDNSTLSVARLAGALVALLLVFQLVLRPGIQFY